MATGRPHLSPGGIDPVRGIIFALVLALFPASAFAAGEVSCALSGQKTVCVGVANFSSRAGAFDAAMNGCFKVFGGTCRAPWLFENTCEAIYASPNNFYEAHGATETEAEKGSRDACLASPDLARPCRRAVVMCDGSAAGNPAPDQIETFNSQASPFQIYRGQRKLKKRPIDGHK